MGGRERAALCLEGRFSRRMAKESWGALLARHCSAACTQGQGPRGTSSINTAGQATAGQQVLCRWCCRCCAAGVLGVVLPAVQPQ